MKEKFKLKTITTTTDPAREWYLWHLYFESLSGDTAIELKNKQSKGGFNLGQHYEASEILDEIW